MFIIVSQDSITESFAKHLSQHSIANMPYFQLNFKGIENDAINILDLGATGRFQKRVSAKEFCEYLINANMQENVKSIYLYMSDIVEGKSFYSFAHDVREYFKKHYNRQVTVFYPSNVNFDFTLLVPPTVTKSKWEVYGVNKSQLPQNLKEVDFNILYSCNTKTLLWDGFDINEWFSKPEHISQSIPQNTNPPSSVRLV